MMLFKQFTIVLFTLIVGAQADERSEWFAERQFWIEQAKGTKTPESMLNLGRIVTGVGRNLDQASPEAKALFDQAKDQLLAIPGHATYYQERIASAHAEHKASVPNALDGGIGSANHGIKSGNYRNERTYGLETLRYLPSPETVGVLGELLADEWVSPHPVQDDWIEPSLAQHVANILAVMPIVKKPAARIDDPTNPGVFIPDLRAWQQWYAQIKAGNRTFRFEGDPIDYDLNGPAPKEKLQRIERDRKRDMERLAGRRKSSPGSGLGATLAQAGQPLSIAAILAAIALGAAVIWSYLKRRNAH